MNEIDATAQRQAIFMILYIIQRFSETEECMVNLVNEKKDYPPGNDHISPFGFQENHHS